MTWSRRTFLASAGTLAATGGAGPAAAAVGERREVPLLQTYVAGSDRVTLRKAARGLRVGAPLRLVREPENDYDARAVAVWTQEGTKLGYVPRIDNQPLTNLMDAGVALRAVVGSDGPDRAHADIRVEVTLPLA